MVLGIILIVGGVLIYNYCLAKDKYGNYVRNIALYGNYVALVSLALIILGIILIVND